MGNNTDGLLGLTNDPGDPNWLDIAKTAGKLTNAIFAFDLRNQNKTTYFYAGSESFPANDAASKLTWVGVTM